MLLFKGGADDVRERWTAAGLEPLVEQHLENCIRRSQKFQIQSIDTVH